MRSYGEGRAPAASSRSRRTSQADRGRGRPDRGGHRRHRADDRPLARAVPHPAPGEHQGLLAAAQAGAHQDRGADRLPRLHDRGPLRRGLRPRLGRALPQPAVHRRGGEPSEQQAPRRPREDDGRWNQRSLRLVRAGDGVLRPRSHRRCARHLREAPRPRRDLRRHVPDVRDDAGQGRPRRRRPRLARGRHQRGARQGDSHALSELQDALAGLG